LLLSDNLEGKKSLSMNYLAIGGSHVCFIDACFQMSLSIVVWRVFVQVLFG
jgi:hypothetical protein